MNITIEKLDINDLLVVSQLIEQSFDKSVVPTLNDEGIETFKKGLLIESLEKRFNSDNLFMVCRNEKKLSE